MKLEDLAKEAPSIHSKLIEISKALEKHYRDMQVTNSFVFLHNIIIKIRTSSLLSNQSAYTFSRQEKEKGLLLQM